MKNEFYHDFTVGFNWWMVFVPAMIVLMVMLAIKNISMNNNSLKLERNFNNRVFVLVSAVSSIIFGIMLYVESLDGIIQWFDNSLSPGDSPVYSLLLAAVAIVFVVMAFFAILCGVAVVASWTREGYLRDKRRGILRAARMEETENQQGLSALNLKCNHS